MNVGSEATKLAETIIETKTLVGEIGLYDG